MEHKEHHKREILFLIGFLILFLIIFLIGFVDIKRGIPVFGIGLPVVVENMTVIILSFLAMVQVTWIILRY
ncbi:MAG: hypothetical protein KKC75_00910 [Nanoarchaeota archaeon]|nr:hypothetical protein [Nanoarchaeota archaeon]MBU1005675.1 hypothetical protein [Nanoarchaeota archaeon]MBU1946900.1 hypothetical protein [Nanoarchaeota archaeon]